MTSIKDTFLKYWFVVSTLVLAVVVFLLDSKGKEIGELHLQIQQQKLGEKLQAIQQQSERSQEDYEKAQDNYRTLVSRHGDVLAKLGIQLNSLNQDVSTNPDRPNT